jgi:hypothetical protein
MAQPKTPADFITERGGPHQLARDLGTDPRTVRMWKVRNRIPRKAWPEVIEKIPGVTLDELRAVEAQGS